MREVTVWPGLSALRGCAFLFGNMKCVILCFVFLWPPFQISLEFRNLAEKYQTVIADICQKMGCGMAEFVDKHVTSKQDWDKVSVSVSRVHLC